MVGSEVQGSCSVVVIVVVVVLSVVTWYDLGSTDSIMLNSGVLSSKRAISTAWDAWEQEKQMNIKQFLSNSNAICIFFVCFCFM